MYPASSYLTKKQDAYNGCLNACLVLGVIGLALTIIGGLHVQGTVAWGMNRTVAQIFLYIGVPTTLLLIPGLFGLIGRSGDL